MIDNVPDTPLGRLYREHIRLILEGNIEAILDQYTADAILISSFEKKPLVFRGREELRQHFQGILAIKDLKTSIGFWGEVDQDLLMITEGIEMTAGGQTAQMRFADQLGPARRQDRSAFRRNGAVPRREPELKMAGAV